MKYSVAFSHTSGFSLIELVVAIIVLSILSASAAIILRGPITSYFDVERRSGLSDAGELSMAKLTLELSGAVPNSVRVTTVGPNVYIEFLPIRSSGRYRIAAPGNPLNFGVPDTGFDVLGPAVNVVAGDAITINDQAGINVWNGAARADGPTAGNGLTTIVYPAKTLTIDSQEHRFQVAMPPVTYVCAPVAGGTGTLTRYSGYAIAAVQPTNVLAPPLSTAPLISPLAGKLSSCAATAYPLPTGPVQRRLAQLVTFSLGFEDPSQADETLNLYHTVRLEALP
ncbi:MAG: type II secretion system protein [Thiobacillaceae bacterium]